MTERIPAFSVTLADCEVQTFRSGGPGGQHQNKTESGARVIHHPSGARGESREHKSQRQNKRAAFLRMVDTPQFKYWVREMLREGPSVEERVEKAMAEDKIRTEIKQDGKWKEINIEDLT